MSVQRELGSLRPFVAIAVAAEGAGPHGDKCRVIPSGACAGPLTFRSFTALAGNTYIARFLAVGVAAGPSVYRSSDRIAAGGLQARLHLATPPRSSVALTLTARRTWLPNYRGARYDLTAVLLGVRLGQRLRDE